MSTQPSSPSQQGSRPRVGVAIVGLGGAVATTMAAGLALLRSGMSGPDGLPLADVHVEGFPEYDDLVLGGWDLSSADLAKAAQTHGVLDHLQLEAASPELSRLVPWPGVGSLEWCRNIEMENASAATGLRARAAAIVADLERFRTETGAERLVVLNLASTERPSPPGLDTVEQLEAALDADDERVSPGMLYAYAALQAGAGYANFTPSVAADLPALKELAVQRGLPVAGKDGKTGQTMIKTVLAPAFRSRALRVEGWYSTNILGNRDGLALDDPASLASKLQTKGSVLDSVLGYPVPDHVVRIDYYRPRGDAKEAWDNIDLVGFLGQRMQMKVDFLCRDSVLAAPLAIEIVRCIALAMARGEGGVAEQLGWFFKAPMTTDADATPEHALHRQERVLLEWLGA